MADFPKAHWMGELPPHKTPVSNFGFPIHGFIVQNSTNAEEAIAWQADTVYSVGDFTDQGTHHYEVTAVQGDAKSGATPPTWPTDGSTAQDDNVTWIDRGLTGQPEGVYDEPLGTKEHETHASGVVSDYQAHNSCQLLQVPNMPAVVRTAAEQVLDATYKHHWQNYALIINNSLHGHNLYWPAFQYEDYKQGAIYIDGNNVPWGIEVKCWPVVSTNVWKLEVWIRCLYGRVGRNKNLWDIQENPAYADGIFRQIATLTISGTSLDIPTGSTYMIDRSTGFVLTRNSRGSVLFAHLYQKDATVGIFRDEAGNKYKLRAVIKIAISGNGLVTDTTNSNGPLGDDITATATLHRDKDDITLVESTTNGQRLEFSETTQIGEWSAGRTHHAPVAPACDNLTYSGFTDTYEANVAADGSPHGTLTDNQVDQTTHLFRCAFDESDNEIDIAYRIREEEFGTYSVGTGGDPRTVIFDWAGNWINDGGTCVADDPDGYDVIDSGPVTNSLTTNIGTDTKYQLLIDGTVVDELVIRDNYYRHHSVTGPTDRDVLDSGTVGSVLEPLSNGTYTNSQIVNGQTDARTYTIQPHIYSLDILGLVIKRVDTGIDYVLSAVATPGGSDDTHKGEVFADDYPSLTGAYHPKTKEVVWNEPGLTDMGDGTTYSFV